MKNWYIVQTFSGSEQKVADTLKEINQYKNKLSIYNVDSITDRGFFLIKKNGSILTSIDEFKLNDYIDIESNDTIIRARVDKINAKNKRK